MTAQAEVVGLRTLPAMRIDRFSASAASLGDLFLPFQGYDPEPGPEGTLGLAAESSPSSCTNESKMAASCASDRRPFFAGAGLGGVTLLVTVPAGAAATVALLAAAVALSLAEVESEVESDAELDLEASAEAGVSAEGEELDAVEELEEVPESPGSPPLGASTLGMSGLLPPPLPPELAAELVFAVVPLPF